MRGASRESWARAQEELAGAVRQPGAAGPLGDELFSVTWLLDAQPALRRALTDISRPSDDRAGLARALLRGKVGEATLTLVAGLAADHWSVPRDLSDATERLAVLATAAAADEAGHLDDVEDELFRFGRILASAPDLAAALSDPLAPGSAKRQLVEGLLARKVSDSSQRLISAAVTHPRGRSLEMCLIDYAQLAAEWRERLIAVVRVAVPLGADERRRLAAALAAAFGRQVHLDILVDPGVLGGISVRIGDEFIDGSVASRLAALRRQLAA
jgi:F-type H+-transporting ATPase subunit delta